MNPPRRLIHKGERFAVCLWGQAHGGHQDLIQKQELKARGLFPILLSAPLRVGGGRDCGHSAKQREHWRVGVRLKDEPLGGASPIPPLS